MLIGNLQSIGTNEMAKAYGIRKQGKSASMRKRKNTYEPSARPQKIEDINKLLSAVKQRIKSGYYNSEDVINDLGESFANIFDKSL